MFYIYKLYIKGIANNLFIFGLSEKDGWFFSPTFGVYQRVNKDVYCYISRYLEFYTVQLYQRATTSLCTLEARSEDNLEALFELGESWLKDFEVWDENALRKNTYHIGQMNWREQCWLK